MPPDWQLRPVDPAQTLRLARGRNLHDLVARMLVARGHTDPELTATHLEASLHSLHDPSLLPGVTEGAERIARARAEGELVLVHGDYDVDGVTGTALLMRLFRLIGVRAEWFVPDRFTDGYSFGPHSIERCRERGASVVISVDNGTSAGETISALADLGIDTIVTDHHEPPLSGLPPAVAIVNPKLEDSAYPFRELCGAGVAFKFAWGVCQTVSGAQRVRKDLREFLTDAMSYVALATVCDVVPLIDENRVLARRGLAALEATQHAGLRALLDVAGLTGKRLFAEDVGFQLGPRLNAAGRLAHAGTAVELMLADDPRPARGLARRLDELNVERRRIEADLLEAARKEARRFEDPARWPVMVVAGQGWHQGVVGVIASRIVREFGRPALVIGLDGDAGRGSARSVPGFDVLAAMHGGADHMGRYGGHEQAAGCDVRADAVDDLREAVCARATEILAGGGYTERKLWIDGALGLEQMTPELMKQIDVLEPFGEANAKPVLYSADARLAQPPRRIGGDGSHLALSVRRADSVHRALGFGMGTRFDELEMGAPLHLVYTPRWNTFRGETNLELVLHDFKVGAAPRLG